MNPQKMFDKIMDACSPDAMSKTEALEFMQEIADLLDASIEALEQEIHDEE